MKTMELEMERMEIIREVVETDSRELLQQLKDVVDAWRGKRGKVVEEEIPPCQFTIKELEREIELAETSGVGIPGDEVWAKMKRKYPELCK